MNNCTNLIEKLIYKLGKYGPIILLLYSLFLLWNNENLFFYYTIGIFVNSLLNLILKGILQHPRPSEDPKEFELALKNGKRFIFKDGIIPHDIFGMPSGHTQSAVFSSVYIYLSLRQVKVFVFYLVISLITIYQRIKYNYHTLLQTIIGGIIGIMFAYYVYYLAQEKITGSIREKPDDFAPI
uniref:Phosphatidic acid phosphatase type 2/haloperoxidase domain-containing protein n=1 Tax=viral metagenome TaxID=1070528 RepID=A0A6C0ER22_9ZZZZ